MVDSDAWQLACKLLRTSAAEVVLAQLARSKEPDAQFLVAAIEDHTSRKQLDKALAALKSLVARGWSRAQYTAAIREPRHLAAAKAVLAKHPEVPDGVDHYLIAVICDGSARSLAALAPTVRRVLAGHNSELEGLAERLERYGRTAGTKRLAKRVRAARLARLRSSPGGAINKLVGLTGAVPARFSLWLEADGARLDLLVNAPSNNWIDLTLSTGRRERSQSGSEVRGGMRPIKRLAELPAWIAATKVDWDWDHARWNTPLRGRAFERLRTWLAGRPVAYRSNAG